MEKFRYDRQDRVLSLRSFLLIIGLFSGHSKNQDPPHAGLREAQEIHQPILGAALCFAKAYKYSTVGIHAFRIDTLILFKHLTRTALREHQSLESLTTHRRSSAGTTLVL